MSSGPEGGPFTGRSFPLALVWMVPFGVLVQAPRFFSSFDRGEPG